MGGVDSSKAAFTDAWSWNGIDWTLSPVASPQAASAFAVYDSARDVVVLFGGTGANADFTQVVWEWDGSSWTQPMPAAAPPPRNYSAATFDSARGVTVLFGGCCDASGNYLQDTWTWNGTTWRQPDSHVAPPVRAGHAMAFDSSRNVTVLFGGCPAPGCETTLSDTWEWDGAAWTQRASSGPGCAYCSMAYDANDAVTVLYAGFGKTESWDGTQWVSIPTGSGQTPSGGAMAYDSKRGLVVMFDGDTWELHGSH
jgi:hypothetical protein